jgi:CDP-glycerol glycerophosphotransferase
MSRRAQGQSGPLISIIIPVFDIEEYLTKCLDSISQQSFDNIEIIAVDGGSEDASGRILDERKKKDIRLTVVHAGQIGPGSARNLGAARAKGEYIWFVDGDDAISADCMSAIAKRIEVTRPDVMFIDYEAICPDGQTEPGYGHGLMCRPVPDSFALSEQPWVIELSMASWNKIIRREFFVAESAAFASYYPHEDIPVSSLLMLKADRLSIFNQACYRYTKDRPGAVVNNGLARRHFRVFESYEAVLNQQFSNGRVISEDVRQAFFRRAIWHYATILDSERPGVGRRDMIRLVPRHLRREFFTLMHRDYHRYRPSGYRPADGLRAIKFRLIEKNAYWAYSILEPVNKLRMRLDRGTRLAGGRFRRRALSRAWR